MLPSLVCQANPRKQRAAQCGSDVNASICSTHPQWGSWFDKCCCSAARHSMAALFHDLQLPVPSTRRNTPPANPPWPPGRQQQRWCIDARLWHVFQAPFERGGGHSSRLLNQHHCTPSTVDSHVSEARTGVSVSCKRRSNLFAVRRRTHRSSALRLARSSASYLQRLARAAVTCRGCMPTLGRTPQQFMKCNDATLPVGMVTFATKESKVLGRRTAMHRSVALVAVCLAEAHARLGGMRT